MSIRQMIEDWSFEDMETQKKVCAKVLKTAGMWSDSEEDCYIMGYKTGALRMAKLLLDTYNDTLDFVVFPGEKTIVPTHPYNIIEDQLKAAQQLDAWARELLGKDEHDR